ncbi:nucleotidyl transferase AbiEii/AbiGii toxin family protein [Photorhabdus sp. SF281]|uniref:nucleotidyl transferase AbiEii/AbiGii toxin family protein n=1 Tax=Photorhabdus sp. SF281 TaxID=3459527 RepID=UPI0040443CA4
MTSTLNNSQNRRFREQQQERLTEWTSALVEQLNQRFQVYEIQGLEAEMETNSSGEKVDIYFPRVKEDSMAYQRDHILLEFGGRNRGEPTARMPVVSYLSGIAGMDALQLPTATVNAYNTGYILWEKLTALHQFCTQTKAPNPARLARHWYDVDCLLRNNFASPYETQEAMCNVVEMKQRRWPVPGVDFAQVAVGSLRLLPDNAERFAAIAGDHQTAVEGGMFFREPDGFAAIADRLRHAQDEINRFMRDSQI